MWKMIVVTNFIILKVGLIESRDANIQHGEGGQAGGAL
jgi:hypothetical protein